ncbi:P-loop containing nucleoside triphosphate hydrolase protein [Radiomyces spectabilis]|uniref:P-loop containing nucleoside triphosphate hydrolase protein n=1 Tax=Radiomyces spectabilis TaxID=64574 RepID=UPI0022202F4B|nr:P-loop containing nucleoside triphosphate hydrolase protein [Radiomyces spectabilis]KAI8368128.1 P-loop containing nucleoside triphosphate hydrolase protein [Radiomyces spectabilis]
MSGKKSKSKATTASSSSSPSTTPDKKPQGKRHIVRSGNAGNSSKSTTTDDAPATEKKSIFGNWTGKTPVSLLHEHCQKQGWEKPIFDMMKRKEGFIGAVKLGKRNKKTGEIQTVTLSPPDPYLPTSVEARHLAATYCLHRINSHMPMHRVLPPDHRDYWQHFEQFKTKNNQWQYSPDPFTARPPPAQTKPAVDRRPVKEHASAAVPMPEQPQKSMSHTMKEMSETKRKQPHPVMSEKMEQYWRSLPAVHMTQENRDFVERVIKRSNLVYQTPTEPLSTDTQRKIIDTLVHMGFRRSHAEEALEYCSDTSSALDWLCLHVPEDDLPPTFMNANYNPTMTTVSHTTQSLGRDWLIKRMTAMGYPMDICEEAMQETNDDDGKALEILQWRLLHGDEPLPVPETMDGDNEEELKTLRQDEAVVLASIYEKRFETEEKGNRVYYRIRMTARTSSSTKQRQPLILEIMVHERSLYPYTLPIFTVECEDLPSYLKLAIIKGLVEEGENNLGSPLVYMCAEWLQDHVDEIIANPPKLRAVTKNMTTLHHRKPKRKMLRTLKKSGPRAKALEDPNGNVSKQLKSNLEAMHTSSEYAILGQVRAKLPADQFKKQIVQMVLQHQVTIVSGETGCGKTTQVPQFIMDEEITRLRGGLCNIICTQPRKISAIGVAERVAAERCEKVGLSVGYAVRGETKVSAETRLQFCTTGVLLRRLQSDPTLTGISHVIIDEVHERSVDSDFLLIILRQVLEKRKDLKVILMSATVNQELFSNYFHGAPFLSIPGFTHPVEDFYLEDIINMTNFMSKMPTPKQKEEDAVSKDSQWANWQLDLLNEGYDERTVKILTRYRNQEKIDYDLVAHTVKHIVDNETAKIDGNAEPAVLIFMPGAMEIKRCIEALEATLPSSGSYAILPLHANLSPQEQTRVFQQVPPSVRKIVVATNVAETSITIEGVVYVIDAGRVKETQFEAASSMMHLVETWASRASCKQRRGRAGRTRPGKCFKLFTRDLEAKKMRAQQVPEILRTPLEQLCLQVKSMGEHDVKSFLRKAIDPPSIQALNSAVHALQVVEAIDQTERGNLTPLGHHMASIPADLRISKMLIFGSIFKCLEPISIVAAIMSLKSPFTSPIDRRDEANEAKQQFLYGKSDWLTSMTAFKAWETTIKSKGMREARLFCEENFLSFPTMVEIQSLKRQYLDAVEDIGFYHRKNKEEYNVNAGNSNLLKSIIFAGLNPNLAKIRMPETKYDRVLAGAVEREKEAREIKFYTKDDGRVFLHPSSTLFSSNNFGASFLTYYSRVSTSKIFIRDGTEVPSYAVLFFGGRVDVDHMGRGVVVGDDGWIKFRAWARIGVLVNQLKRLLSAELELKIQNPNEDASKSEVTQAIIALITKDGI